MGASQKRRLQAASMRFRRQEPRLYAKIAWQISILANKLGAAANGQ